MTFTFRWIALMVMLSAVFGLSACSERPQTIGDKASAHQEKPWAGAKDPFVAKGWTVGNEGSWRAQMHNRVQNQNEYVRMGD